MEYVLSERAAKRVAELLRMAERPIPANSSNGGTGGRHPVLVRCTSATAAGGSGVAAQCYPAVVIDVDATVDEQPELASGVWLTVLGDDGAAESPTEDQLYHGLISGDFDPDPEGTSDNRPRVFAVAPAAGGSPSWNVDIGATFAITSSTTWQDAGGSIPDQVLPGAGVYVLFFSIVGQADVSALTGPGRIRARFYDETHSSVVGPGEGIELTSSQVVNVQSLNTGTLIYPYEVTEATTVRIEGWRGPGTWTTSNLLGTPNTAGGIAVGWFRL